MEYIYVLISEYPDDYETICISKDIKQVYYIYLNYLDKEYFCPKLEIWLNGMKIEEHKKDDVLTKIVSIINEQGGLVNLLSQ